MKIIGIIGGMSWESTSLYYTGLNRGIKERRGGLSSARILMSSLDFEPIAKMQSAGEWDALGGILAAEAARLEQAGADAIALTSNTMHKLTKQIRAAVEIPFIHLADATAERILQAGLRRVGLMGTGYTMREAFYKSRLEAQGIEVDVPGEAEMDQINGIIFGELCQGVLKQSSKDAFLQAANGMIGRGAEGVVLGCTEIGLLVSQADLPKPVFDTTQIHIAKILDFALS